MSFGVLQSASTMLGSIFLYVGGVRAARVLHRQMLKTVLRAPMSFFDMTPLGRIINRFSKDMYMIDESIPESLFWCIFCFFIILSIIVVISYTTPIFLSIVVPIGLFYFFSQVRQTDRQANRQTDSPPINLCFYTAVLCDNIPTSHETGIDQSLSYILSLSRDIGRHQHHTGLPATRAIYR